MLRPKYDPIRFKKRPCWVRREEAAFGERMDRVIHDRLWMRRLNLHVPSVQYCRVRYDARDRRYAMALQGHEVLLARWTPSVRAKSVVQ